MISDSKRNHMGKITQSNLITQETTYAENCLPLTIELAKQYKRILSPKLKKFPKSWPFGDKVLVLLVPSLLNDVINYHSKDGPSMSAMFEEHLLEHFDKDLKRMLYDILNG
jgi:hypothetical protein